MFGFTFWKCQYLYRQVNYKIPTLKLTILLIEFFHILIVPCNFSTSMKILCLYFVYQSYSCWFFNVSSKIVAFIFERTKALTQGCSLKNSSEKVCKIYSMKPATENCAETYSEPSQTSKMTFLNTFPLWTTVTEGPSPKYWTLRFCYFVKGNEA